MDQRCTLNHINTPKFTPSSLFKAPSYRSNPPSTTCGRSTPKFRQFSSNLDQKKARKGFFGREGGGAGLDLRFPVCRSGLRSDLMATEMDDALLIVGPGVLGSYLGKLWVDDGKTVVGQTNTVTNHGRLKQLGIIPKTREDSTGEFPNVVFCAPPSGSTDFVEEIKNALKRWNKAGSFVYTSSTGVFKEGTGEVLNEDSELLPEGTSDRIDVLLKAEQAVKEAGGNILRLGGLYHANRGAHTFYIKNGPQIDRWGGYSLNVIHYEDAARMGYQILSGGDKHRGEVFLGLDGNPLTLQEMMDFTVSSGAFNSDKIEFIGKDPRPVKEMDNSKTLEKLGGSWSCKYRSFKEFMENGAKDWYSSTPLW